MRKKRTDKLKEHQKGDHIPWDFWNYNINIILGYKYKPTIIKKIDWKKYKNDSAIK